MNNTTTPSTRITQRKIGNLTVNVKSRFYSEKSLSDSLFVIASAKLNEKPA